ncbi:MAG: peptidoglycan-binding protein [Patescibacteria group bacterium]
MTQDILIKLISGLTSIVLALQSMVMGLPNLAAVQQSSQGTVLGATTGEFYVSPSGTSSGDGSITSPWDLQTALNQPASVQPGDTIWLRGGTYKGWYVSKLVGTSAQPIIVRSYPGEWAVLDWNVNITLVNAISETDTTITISDISQLNGNGFTIEDGTNYESIYVRGVGSNNSLSVIRGWSGYPAKAFPAGARVFTGQANLLALGQNTWFWDFEITNSYDKNRILTTLDPRGDESNRLERRLGGINNRGQDVKFINLVIHDVGDGVGTWEQSIGNSEFSGLIVYSNGWTSPSRGHGHGFYIQSNAGSVNLNDVISFNNHATGQKVFGYQGHGNNVSFDGFTSFGNNEGNFFLGTGSYPMTNIHVKNSYIYSPPVSWGGGGMTFGWSGTQNNDVEIKDNYIAGRKNGLAVEGWNSAVVTGNTIWVSGNPWGGDIAFAKPNTGIPASAFTWNYNTYFDNNYVWENGKTYSFSYPGGPNTYGGGQYDYDLDWLRLTPFDKNSTYTQGTPGGVPPENKIFVRPNKYETGRANIIIYNWLKQSSVEVNISGTGLASGDRFEVRDVQNYFGSPVLTGIYSGQPISIPMTGLAIYSPVGTLANMPIHTAPEFGAFVLIKTASGGGTPTPPPPTLPPATTPSPTTTPAPTTPVPATPTTPTPTTPLSTTALPPQVILETLNPLQTSLGIGTKNATQEITSLQTFLFLEKYLSEDQISGSFDTITDAAVKKYQCDKSIICSGPAWGNVGRTTRDKINTDIFRYRSAAISAPIASSQQISKNISLGARGTDVTILQTFLIKQGHLTADNVTGYFGYATQSAVQKFQKAMNIISSGNPNSTGYGAVGNITRGKINSLLFASSASPVSIQSLKAQIEALQKQVQELLVKLQKTQ